MAISIHKSYSFTFWQPLPPPLSNKEASNPKSFAEPILETEKETKSELDFAAKPQVGTFSTSPIREGKLKCPVEACGKLFLKKCGLKTHMVLKHKEETRSPYFLFPSKAKKEKTYKCSVGDCQLSFARKCNLSQHFKLKHCPKTSDTTPSNTHSPSSSAEEKEEAAFILANLQDYLLPTEKI